MKKGIIHVLFIIMIFPVYASASQVDDYQGTWVNRAHKLQRKLDLTIPISRALFVSTHNTYNALAYTGLFCYWDPNHKYCIYDQLRMDVREIELDVHKYFSMKGWPWEWKNKLLLSHGQDNHVGVSAFDREFSDGLGEIARWIREAGNRDEVLIIDIEDRMDGEYDMALDIIKEYLGDLIYRPENGPRGLPMDISKADILAAGRQIVLISKGDNHSEWRSWVFTGVGSKNGFYQDKPQFFGGFPQCGEPQFTENIYDNFLVRVYEDSTNISDWFSDPGEPITTKTVEELVKCGVNVISMDQLKPFDGRLEKAIWSWDKNEPNNYNNEDCAVHKPNGRFNDAFCGNTLRFACKNSITGEWHITDSAGPWHEGEAYCLHETNNEAHFDVPRDARDNELLKEAKYIVGTGSIWLNYQDLLQENNWESGADTGLLVQEISGVTDIDDTEESGEGDGSMDTASQIYEEQSNVEITYIAPVVRDDTEEILNQFHSDRIMKDQGKSARLDEIEVKEKAEEDGVWNDTPHASGGCGFAANASNGMSMDSTFAGLMSMIITMLVPLLLITLFKKARE